jgi:hypothetical protein
MRRPTHECLWTSDTGLAIGAGTLQHLCGTSENIVRALGLFRELHFLHAILELSEKIVHVTREIRIVIFLTPQACVRVLQEC